MAEWPSSCRCDRQIHLSANGFARRTDALERGWRCTCISPMDRSAMLLLRHHRTKKNVSEDATLMHCKFCARTRANIYVRTKVSRQTASSEKTTHDGQAYSDRHNRPPHLGDGRFEAPRSSPNKPTQNGANADSGLQTENPSSRRLPRRLAWEASLGLYYRQKRSQQASLNRTSVRGQARLPDRSTQHSPQNI